MSLTDFKKDLLLVSILGVLALDGVQVCAMIKCLSNNL